MKLLDLFEAPISDIQFKGDFEVGKKTTFPDVDKRLIKSPKYQAKIYNAFQKTPYDFRIMFIDLPANNDDMENADSHEEPFATNYIERLEGIFDQETLPYHLQDIGIKSSPNSITVAIIHDLDFAPSVSSQHMPITPWIIAHKIGHALSKEVNSQIMYIMQRARQAEKSDDYNWFSKFLTFKSARNPRTPQMELTIDMVAQFLIQGRVSLNRNVSTSVNIEDMENHVNVVLKRAFDKLNGTILVAG